MPSGVDNAMDNQGAAAATAEMENKQDGSTTTPTTMSPPRALPSGGDSAAPTADGAASLGSHADQLQLPPQEAATTVKEKGVRLFLYPLPQLQPLHCLELRRLQVDCLVLFHRPPLDWWAAVRLPPLNCATCPVK